MSFPLLEKYKAEFSAHSALLSEFESLYKKKLWHQLSLGILKFIFMADVKGKLSFNFYTDFIKKFDRNIDQITNLKILKECLANLNAESAITFLQNFEEKDAFTDETKSIAAGLRAIYYIGTNNDKCSEIYHRLQKFLRDRKDADSFAFSTFYRFAWNYFLSRNKQKLFYQNALQYLSYTPAEEIEEKAKIELLSGMGIAILTSPEIYNFSELLEQPLLVSLQSSHYKWVYELLSIFNQGNIEVYNKVIEDACSREAKLASNRKSMDQKIRLMALLQLAFNLPKNNRVIPFSLLAQTCAVPIEQVEFMVMKAASLNLIKVEIDQISQSVLIAWVAPKVLGNDRIEVMLSKFNEWQQGTKQVEAFIMENWKVKV